MRPSGVHRSILIVFALVGVALLLMEMMTSQSGGFIRKYTFTKLYWLALSAYALVSTLLVLLVWLIQRKRGKVFSRLNVVACHVMLMGGIWVFIMSGLHDRIEDAWKPATDIQAYRPPQQPVRSLTINKLPMPSAPAGKLQQYHEAGGTIDVQQQTAK